MGAGIDMLTHVLGIHKISKGKKENVQGTASPDVLTRILRIHIRLKGKGVSEHTR